jgi:hypothetical protein
MLIERKKMSCLTRRNTTDRTKHVVAVAADRGVSEILLRHSFEDDLGFDRAKLHASLAPNVQREFHPFGATLTIDDVVSNSTVESLRDAIWNDLPDTSRC